jgi:hypothetical protein
MGLCKRLTTAFADVALYNALPSHHSHGRFIRAYEIAATMKLHSVSVGVCEVLRRDHHAIAWRCRNPRVPLP